MIGFIYGLTLQPQERKSACQTGNRQTEKEASPYLCLLYTSDAADERSSVDLGGRRIIKKKKKKSKKKKQQSIDKLNI